MWILKEEVPISLFWPRFGGLSQQSHDVSGSARAFLSLEEDYSTCIIGVPDRRYLWIMARTPTIEETTLEALISKSRALGALIWTKKCSLRLN